MKVDRIWPVIVVIIVVAVAAAAVIMIPEDGDSGPNGTKNDGVIAMKDFSVKDEGTGSETEGSVIVRTVDDRMEVTVLASIDIAEEDFGGVTFYCDGNFDPASVLTSYQDDPGANSTIMVYNSPDDDIGGYVGVGMGHTFAGGGTGFIEVVFESLDGVDPGSIGQLQIVIGVGSDGDVPAIGTTSETVVIDLAR